MGNPSEDLNTRLKAAADKKIGGKALTSRFGIDCFALVDALLRSLGAQSAADFGKVTAKADYKWGDGILLDSIQPGDILQFRDHVVDVSTQLRTNGTWREIEGRTQKRPHHTAIVLEVLEGGGAVVVEQNVRPDRKKVTRNVIPRLEEGEDTRAAGTEKRTVIKVTGSVSAYRPVPKPAKGASLFCPTRSMWAGGRPVTAWAVPAKGGAKRFPGPVGMG